MIKHWHFLWPVETDNKPATLDTLRVSPEASELCSLLNDRPILSSVFNFLRGFSLHNLYSKNPGFNSSKSQNSFSYLFIMTYLQFHYYASIVYKCNSLHPIQGVLKIYGFFFFLGMNTGLWEVLSCFRDTPGLVSKHTDPSGLHSRLGGFWTCH